MRIHPRRGSVVSTLALMLIAVFICRAQSVQSSSTAAPIFGAKPLLLEKNEGELRVRAQYRLHPHQAVPRQPRLLRSF